MHQGSIINLKASSLPSLQQGSREHCQRQLDRKRTENRRDHQLFSTLRTSIHSDTPLKPRQHLVLLRSRTSRPSTVSAAMTVSTDWSTCI